MLTYKKVGGIHFVTLGGLVGFSFYRPKPRPKSKLKIKLKPRPKSRPETRLVVGMLPAGLN